MKNRSPERFSFHELKSMLSGIKSADAPIYFERNVDPSQCVDPRISSVRINREHRFTVQ